MSKMTAMVYNTVISSFQVIARHARRGVKAICEFLDPTHR
jgi:hypothetical protein